LVRLWWATLRMEIPAEDLEVLRRQGEPTLFILWHNRLFLTGALVLRHRGGHPLYALISASGDGEWLAALFSHLGLGAVRGSSSRLGREAATALIDRLRQGFDAGITPDGPRGPCYELKPGAMIVARRARTRNVLVGMDFESAWRLSSWDGFYLPRPFSRVSMRFVEHPIAETGDRVETARLVGGRLAEINPDRRPPPLRSRG
jgi:lysophospholipid acyltransferase (LPLAT)-like uncharacterized protein